MATKTLEPETAEGLEPAGDDDELETPEALEDDPDGERLFDAAMFETEELRLPPVDGHSITKVQAKFGGGPWLDRSSPADCALIRDQKLGTRVTLLVDAIAGPPVPGFSTNRSGDLDVISLSRKFVVESVMVSAQNLSPLEMLQAGVRRLLAEGRAFDEVQELVTEAAETSGSSS